MKKFLSSPVVALILIIIVVCGSTVVNTRVKLGKQCDALNETFYSSSFVQEPTIADSLRKLCNASEQLVLLGTKYDVDDAEDAMEAIDDIRSAIRNQSNETASIFKDYEELLKETFALESALSRMQLSETDEEAYASAQHSASEAKADIDSSSYNDRVRAFQKRYHSFPTPQIAKLSGVSFPELFA